jgi:geranylgeranyl pyrophosphate synthase
MPLEHIVYRLVTDRNFAYNFLAAPESTLRQADDTLSAEEGAALMEILGLAGDWQHWTQPETRFNLMTPPYDKWPAGGPRPGLETRLADLWNRAQISADFIDILRSALPAKTHPLTLGNQPEAWSTLTLLCCQAAGGQPQMAEPVAAAWTLLSTACHLLDDLADGDRPDSWVHQHGLGATTVAATGLMTTAWQLIGTLRACGVDDATTQELTDTLQRDFLQVCMGQLADINKREPRLADCWRINALKSGVFFAMASWAGARLATADRTRLHHFYTFGYHVGMLIQLANDIGGVWRASEQTSDLRAGPRWTLPVAYAMSVADTTTRVELAAYLATTAATSPQTLACLDRTGVAIYLATSTVRHREAAAQAAAHGSLDRNDGWHALNGFLRDLLPSTYRQLNYETLPSQELVRPRAYCAGTDSDWPRAGRNLARSASTL